MNRILLAFGALLLASAPATGLAQTVISVNLGASRHAISPMIYGTAYPTTAQLLDLNFTMSRWGGNEASSYNWEANAAAKGNDWYFESWANDSSSVAGEAIDSFVSTVKQGGASPILTLPMLNYVGQVGPNRSTIWSYSVAKYGAQTGTDPSNSDAGNGISAATGLPITTNDPLDANTPNSLAMQQAWLNHLISTWGNSSNGGIKYYVMDNEPSIWYSTHQDVHPIGESYDELYNDYVTYAGAIRAADPNAVIAGPEEWGWTGYLYSGKDMQYAAINGWGSALPDYTSHGNMNHVPWLLQSLKQYQTTYGVQLLNMLSLHYYPQQGEFSNDDSAGMQAIRNRSTRSLWDPNYVDTSWIDSVVMLIPRMKNWVSTYYPGLQTAITEYNWGDEGEMNGATTQADILGIFGQQGLDMSSRWTTPATDSPAYLAMKIYRNYDGQKSTFGDTSVSCSAPDPDNVSAFAALRSSDGALTVMLINKLTTASATQVNISGLSTPGTMTGWQISSSSSSSITQLASAQIPASGFGVSLPPQSVTIYVIKPFTSGIESVTLAPDSVLGGGAAKGTVTLYKAAPKAGWVVDLASNDASQVRVPSSVMVKSGQTTASFNATTKASTQDYSATITGTDSLSSQSTTLSVMDDSVASVAINPNPVTGGSPTYGTVTLSQAAPSSGWTVKLVSSSPSRVTAPRTVTVSSGATTAQFTVTTKASTAGYSATVTALDALSSASGSLSVLDDSVENVILNPNPVPGGSPSSGTVTLRAAAPVGGWVVRLTSNNSKVTVPSSVTISQGAASVTFTASTTAFTQNYTVRVTASDAASSEGGNLTVQGDSISGLSISPGSVVGGAAAKGTITLHGPAPIGGWTVNLVSSNGSVVSVIGSVTVPAGSSSMKFSITTGSVSTTTVVSITASDALSQKSANITVKG